MIFNRPQNWLAYTPKYTYIILKDTIIEKFNIQCGFSPHYSQIHTIYAIMNTGNPYSILIPKEDSVYESESSIVHLCTTKHGRNKLKITYNGKSANIFLNKLIETAYIDLAIECSIYIISKEVGGDLIKYILLKAACDDNFIVDDILTTIGMNFIVLHFMVKNEI